MKTPSSIPPKGKIEVSGTALGTTISMLLLIAFGLSSYMNQQDSDHRYAAEHSNRPTVISAYFA